ncbi:hypothetical protein K7432_000347 [Basidiobolus ranarum]|uniref:Uncharacterized protein n=1 Tax=Basidiobolus ranarum TaxID=34480 RepID=A0ABR2X535_9FUNG
MLIYIVFFTSEYDSLIKDDVIATSDYKSENKGGYSNFNYKKVLEFLGIKSREFLAKDSELKEADVDSDTLNHIVKSLINLTKAEGVVDDEGETTRGDFVLTILYNIVALYYDKEVKLEREFNLVGDDVKVEAKQEGWNLGRAQNLMQLYNAYIRNISSSHKTDHTVYGAITSGYTWEIIWCIGPKQEQILNINDVEEIKSKLQWEHKAKFDPVEMDISKAPYLWKQRLLPLVKYLAYMIESSFSNS